MLEVRQTGLPGVVELRPRRFTDERGFFSEIWNAEGWAKAGIAIDWQQDNHSLSRHAGVLRGLHYQLPPADQFKLVRVTRGSVWDVAVDIRRSSPTFGRHIGITLSPSEWNQLLIPPGFAHGFVTLEPDTEVQYKVSAPYSPMDEASIRWNDPSLAIAWPLPIPEPILSERDRSAPLLADARLFD